jgi:Mor family transcriptional regulator
LTMHRNGDKVSYIVAALSEKYAVSERKVYGLLKRFQSDCKPFAV